MNGICKGAIVAIFDEEKGVLFDGEITVETHYVLMVEGGESAEGLDFAEGEGVWSNSFYCDEGVFFEGVALEDYAVGTFSQLELIIYLVIIIDIGPFFDLLPIKLYCHYFILFLISSIGII